MINESQESQAKDISQDKEPIELVREIHKELSEYRKPFEKEWREYDDAYYGKQHKSGEEKKTVKNHIFKIIEGEVPILTDSMPGTQVDAELAEKQPDADTLDKAIRYVHQDNNLPLLLPTLVRSALTSAPGYIYAFYNPDANGGDGKIEYLQLPWQAVFLDGNRPTIELAERARIEISMRRDSLARMWPEKRKEILGISQENSDIKNGDGEMREDRDQGTNAKGGAPGKYKSKDIVKYVETWIKDFSTEPIPAEETQERLAEERREILSLKAPTVNKWQDHNADIQDHYAQRGEILANVNLPADAPYEQVEQAVMALLEQNPEAEQLKQGLLLVKIIDNHIEEHQEMLKLNPNSERPKFKDGWRLIKSAADLILYDGGNPEERDGIGHIPIVPFYAYKDQTIYGFGEVKNIIDPQRTLNTMDWFEYEGLQVCTNPGWIEDHEAEVPAGALTNEPGIRIKKKKGTEVRRLEPGQISPQLERRKLMDAEFIMDASGINDESQGNMASSASGIAISKIQTQAIGRIRLKDRYLQYYSMKRLAIIDAQLILNHWTDEKNFRLRSDNTSIEDVVFDPLKMADLGYTVTTSPGSMAGLDKDALNAFYLNLFQVSGGQMTFEDLLTVAEFPKKEILLAKVKERADQQQIIQQVQSQLEQLQTENASLKGLVGNGVVLPEEKKVFELAAKQALAEKLMMAEQQKAQSEMNGNAGVNPDQPAHQGNM